MAASLGGVLIACSDDTTSGGATTPPPGTSNEAGVTPPGTGSDAAADAGDAAPPEPAHIIVVHAGGSLGPDTDEADTVRVCFKVKTPVDSDFKDSPFPALPNAIPTGADLPYPGIPVGSGGLFPTSHTDYTTIALRPYLMNAKTLHEVNPDEALGCAELLSATGVDGGALTAGVDYWQLPDIPAGSLQATKTYLLAVVGCADNAVNVGGGALCGAKLDGTGAFTTSDTPGSGNLRTVLMELDTTTAIGAGGGGGGGDGALGAQFAHLSPSYQAAVTLGQTPLHPFFGNPDNANQETDAGMNDPDGGRFSGTPSGAVLSFNVAATKPTDLVKVQGVNTTNAYLAPFVPDTDGTLLTYSLNNSGSADNNGEFFPPIQFASTGSLSTDPYITNGKAYTFVILGSPSPAEEVPNKKLHILAFPNVFTPPELTSN